MQLHKGYLGSLVILAFPCNQFGAQEPGTASEIKEFVKQYEVPVDDTEYGFYVMEKVEVNGPGTHPVYQFLKSATPESSDIKWNFASYWLVDAAGKVERLPGGRSSPSTFFEKIEAAVKA
mmetsp:Transcript_118496/g.205815  ORF Transcript_118496/g.205815 Transcript_118496/m.205815 type:complete len:120 (-) Transcript_118496:57-416(-)